MLMAAFEAEAMRVSGIIPIHNFDEVPWLLADAGGVYIWPLANPKAYAGDTVCLPMPESLRSDVSLVWRADNKNPDVNLLCSAIRSKKATPHQPSARCRRVMGCIWKSDISAYWWAWHRTPHPGRVERRSEAFSVCVMLDQAFLLFLR